MRRRALGAGVRLASRRLRRARQRRPGVFFEPSPGLRDFFHDRSKRQCVIAANRVGKTKHAIEKLARRLKAVPGTRARIVAPTNRQGYRIHGKYLAESLGADLAEGSRWNAATGFNGGNMARLRNGSTCELTSYEQAPDAHAGASLHIVLLDEPPPIAHYEEALARVFDVEGEVWITLTAVGRPVKWLREIVEQGVRDGDWSFHQVALSVANCPWYTPDQVADRIREARRQPWSYLQRIEGEWDGVSEDRRFASFTDEALLPLTVGLREAWPKPGKTVHLVLSIDHGEGPGHSHWTLLGYQVVGRTQYGPKLYIRAISEWVNPRRMSVPKEARAIQAWVRGLGLGLEQLSWGVGDTNTAQKSEMARTLNEAFEQAFAELMGRSPEQPTFRIRAASKGPGSVDEGVATCNGLADGGELVVSEACVGVVQAIKHWAGRNDDLKHAADSLRYGVTAIVTEVGWEPARLMAA